MYDNGLWYHLTFSTLVRGVTGQYPLIDAQIHEERTRFDRTGLNFRLAFLPLEHIPELREESWSLIYSRRYQKVVTRRSYTPHADDLYYSPPKTTLYKMHQYILRWHGGGYQIEWADPTYHCRYPESYHIAIGERLF